MLLVALAACLFGGLLFIRSVFFCIQSSGKQRAINVHAWTARCTHWTQVASTKAAHRAQHRKNPLSLQGCPESHYRGSLHMDAPCFYLLFMNISFRTKERCGYNLEHISPCRDASSPAHDDCYTLVIRILLDILGSTAKAGPVSELPGLVPMFHAPRQSVAQATLYADRSP
jgi:hypothetical protein